MSRFVSPVEIAKRICVFEGDTSFSHLGRVMVAVGQATTDVYENAIPVVRSEFVQIMDNMTAPVPGGAARILKVGALNDHAQIIHLYEDNRLRRYKVNELNDKVENCDVVAGYITKPTPREYVNPGDWFHGCSHNVGRYGELYGYRFDQATIGTWRNNEMDGVIEFGTGPFVQPGRWVLVEFKDMGEGRFAIIPSEAVSAIITRARWWLSGGGNRGAAHMQDFKREYFQYRRNILRMDIMEYLRAFGDDRVSPHQISASAAAAVSSTSTSSTSGGTSSGGDVITNTPLEYYNGDTDAIANGLAPGDWYLLTDHTLNEYSLPGGLPKVVYNGP